jgi:hypothetical protein
MLKNNLTASFFLFYFSKTSGRFSISFFKRVRLARSDAVTASNSEQSQRTQTVGGNANGRWQ